MNDCVDSVARSEIAAHERKCDERHLILRAAIGRIEKVLLGVAGSVILFLANAMLKVV